MRAALAFILTFLSLLAFPPAGAPAKSLPAAARAGFVHVGTIGEVLSSWRPKTHLYVFGDVGLGEAALRELAAWIGDRHWTVLLVADARGETYRSADGALRQGEDALEYGTGQGIPKRAGFLAQVDPRTQQPDGAILTIVLAQHVLFYTGSQAQDSRGLGEAQFRGNLDQWAIAAMRSGGDVVSAVKDTITNVEARLAGAIDQEVQRVETARRGVESAKARLVTLEQKAAALHASHPAMNGPLAHLDVEALRQRLAAAERSAATDPEGTIREVEAVQGDAATKVRGIDDYPAFGKALAAAQARLGDLERRERAASAREELAIARQSLAEARDRYDRGAAGYSEQIGLAKAAVDQAEERLASIDSEAAVLRFVLRFLLLLLAAALVAAGFVLNRRRRGAKREAEQLLAAWRTALDRKLAALFDELERRVGRFVGPASGDGKRPYTGETLRLAEQIRADVGSLSILWTSASGILGKAEALIQGKGLAVVYNFFFPGRYRRGITLLKDEPVPFDPADGLPRLFGAERTWRDDLLGDLASYEPFRKSFQEIVAELDLRAARATEALGRVESGLTQGPSTLEETATQIRQAAARREEIERAGADDGLFRIPAVFAEVLPAAEALLAQGRARFATDPVGALDGEVTRAGRIARDSAQLVDLVAGARQGVLTAVDRGAAALREGTIAAGWIEEERRRLSSSADLLAARAVESGIASEIEELGRSLAGLGARVERTVALSRTLGETVRPEIQRAGEVVQAARGELGRALGLAPERILREADADPSERLDGAVRQAGTAREKLGCGDLEAAAAALAAAARLTAEAAAIVEATRQAFAAQEATVSERRAETERIERLLPDHERILAAIREAFAPSVLSLRPGDPEHPGANGTLADNLDETRAHVELAHGKLDQAVAAFPLGNLLAAARLLREVKGHQELAIDRLQELAERQARLARTVVSNQALLATLEDRVREDQISIAGDPRAMPPTVAAFEDGGLRVHHARVLVEAKPGDPLAAEDELLAAQAILGEVHDRMAPSDRLCFAEAQKSIEAAQRQLAAAGELARRATGDGIPDSPDITRGLTALGSLTAAQAQARAALGAPHGDWNALDAEADRIMAEGTRWAATLQGEIAAGEKAAAALAKASGTVREAGGWRGAYGVVITGRPGSGSLSEARTLLEQGQYVDAATKAGEAQQEAAAAIAAAAEQERALRAEEQRREEQRRWEEERRQEERSRQEASVHSFSSSGGSSSGSGSSSWGSSSSGSGSSSWGSSDSGSGKSGW
ncbi:MAG TPA: hypothetical protein VF173_00210 [Thermoanaerobaculia bacterium]|nr:hypothetical protein [Thermoanaerobaculia bacterium]